jgi:hypothetical protein
MYVLLTVYTCFSIWRKRKINAKHIILHSILRGMNELISFMDATAI